VDNVDDFSPDAGADDLNEVDTEAEELLAEEAV
jgi:hypothetical protein